MNTLGRIFRLTTFGESHGKAIGGIIDGMPSNINIDFNYIQSFLNKRRSINSILSTSRIEEDKVEFLSGIYNGYSTGTSIGFLIFNKNVISSDYDNLKNIYRPSHADLTYQKKYNIRDHRGGGRSSARETANWVVAGGIAKHIIPNIQVYAYVSCIGKIELKKKYNDVNVKNVYNYDTRCPDKITDSLMQKEIMMNNKIGDTIGGEITCVIKNVDIGLGEPIFDKLQSRLAMYIMSINATKSFEYGLGSRVKYKSGSKINDIFKVDGTTKTNYSGGIQGGISNGMDIYFKVTFKPVSSIKISQTVLDNNNNIINDFSIKGRHDSCVVPRAVPIVESLVYMALADFYLINKLYK